MTSLSNISSEVESISAVIRHARGVIEAEGLVELSPIEIQVNSLCSRLHKLGAEEGVAFQPRILTLIDEFSELGGLIESRLEGLRGDLKRTGGRTQALPLHEQTAQTAKPKS